MRLFLTILSVLCLHLAATGQMFDPVDWTFSSTHLEDKTYELTFKANIEAGWAIYSQNIGEGGPIPTEFIFDDGDHFTLVGETMESDNAKTSHDPIFDMKLIKFFKNATFTQRVEVADPTRPVTGYLTFMTCDDERCLPPKDVEFSFSLKSSDGSGSSDARSANRKIPESEEIPEPEAAEDPTGEIDNSDIAIDFGTDDQSGIYQPVTWSSSYEELGAGEYSLTFTADIEEGWNIYSQDIDPDKIGPIPTTIYFNEQEGLDLIGEVIESEENRYTKFDPIFEMELTKFRDKAVFSQRVSVAGDVTTISGELDYMTCNDERCIPEVTSFVIDLTAPPGAETLPEKVVGADLPVDDNNVIDQTVASIKKTYEEPVGECQQEEVSKDKTLLKTFIFGFLGGLLALLTPCVFPMIPLTVSFFSKDSKRKGWWNGTVYGVSIIVIYVAIGLIITGVFGATALNQLSTNWIANTLFFLVFIFFAFSFFGFYEIQLPSKWANKSDRMADKGGYIGIFFMAFTLALVSFSCTGPIIGTALVESATNSMGPFIVMLGFSSALALPFGLFAAFPSWLNSLPRSGSWMNSVKVILGFLELALAFKFLSVADMTSHWNVLKYEPFLAIWTLVAIGMALYLFGVIRFPHDSPMRRLTPFRGALAIGMSALAIYLATGFLYDERTKTYNSLPMLSGLAPPAHYNFFMPTPEPDPEIKARFPSYSKCANNLECFHDYHEGVAYAKEVNKPIFLDFTGYGCVNCRKTEEHIWVRDEVWSRLKNDFVMISLYVDDRRPLDEPLYSKPQEEILRNIGRKWADFQIVNFKQNSQPLYVILSPDERVLATPRGYREGVKEYAEFLQCGLNTFRELDTQLGELKDE